MRIEKEHINVTRNVDWTLIVIYLILVTIGLVNAYSTGLIEDGQSFLDFGFNSGRQLMWFGISIGVGALILLLETSFIRKNAYWFYGGVMFMLVCVLFFPAVNGQKSWFGWGSIGVQPSEFAKTATALALAKYLTTINIKIQDAMARNMAVLIIGIPCALILLQPDPGTLLVFASFALVMYREGLSGNILLFGFLSIIIGVLTLLLKSSSVDMFGQEIKGHYVMILVLWLIALLVAFLIKNFIKRRDRKNAYVTLLMSFIVSVSFIFVVDLGYSKILKQHHRDRIELQLGIKEDPDGKDYNRNRAMASVGSGDFWGKGYTQSTLANARLDHVPEQSTDFAYCTWSEEFGFLGSSGIVVIFMIFLLKIVEMAERQRSQFSRIYGYSVACIFFMHFMINIGMITGLAPVVGIPLPFISYGGSSLLSFSILLFVLVKLDSDRKEVLR